MKKRSVYIVIAVIVLAGVGLGIHKAFMQSNDPYAKMAAPALPEPPLKKLAKRKNLQIGSFASLKYLRERPYREILTKQFNYAIIDGEPNWKFEDFTLRPSADTFNFTHLDQAIGFAEQYAMPVRVQHLLWGDEKWLPDWLKNGKYSQQELLQIIHHHIATVGARYKGKVREYTVVNEAFSRKIGIGGNRDWWGERLGTDYIDKAFIWAREADPNAKLILNDFGNETEGDTSNLMYDYIKSAKARGVPIDGLGMQMHIDGTKSPSKTDVVKNMRRFADLGVKIYVTEFDVNMHDVKGSQKDKDNRQAAIYNEMLSACLEAGPDVCSNFGFLGLVDRQSWYNGIGINDADPLLFTSYYKPKPAFFAIRNTLENK